MANIELSGDDEDWNHSNWISDASSQREDEAYYDALASTAALVEENVLDSPTRTSQVFRWNSSPLLNTLDLNESRPANVPTQVIPPPLTPEDANALSPIGGNHGTWICLGT